MAGRRGDAAERSFLEVLAHELRSPLAAILGYQELAGDGVYGPLPAGAADALHRIGRSARHLLLLVDALEHLEDGTEAADDAVAEVAVVPLLEEVLAAAAEDAAAREVTLELEVPDPELEVRADPRLLRRLAELLCAAVLKGASEGRHALAARRAAAGRLELVLERSPLRPGRDDPALPAEVATGAGLRLLLARRVAGRMGGTLSLAEDGTLTASLPGGAPS